MRYNIKKLLREVVGVPKGIVDSARILYNQILNNFNDLEETDNNNYQTQFEIDLLIGEEYQIDKINFLLSCFETSKVTQPTLVALGLGSEFNIDPSKLKVEYSVDETVTILIRVAVPEEDLKLSDVYQLLIEQKAEMIRSLTHELKHAYDKYKKSSDKIYPTAMYQSYTSLTLGLPPIDKFLYYLYFIHSTEGLVRASEVAASMKEKEITQKKFLDFITNDKTYKQLKEISEFSYEGLRESLTQYEPQIDQILSKIDESTDKPLDEKIDIVLRAAYITILNHKAETTRQFLQTTLPEKIFGILHPNKEIYFRKILNKLDRFKNYKEFFEYEEKMFKFVAKKLMKKISKLYTITNTEQDDILNWELHQKLNKKTKFVKESKFFRRGK